MTDTKTYRKSAAIEMHSGLRSLAEDDTGHEDLHWLQALVAPRSVVRVTSLLSCNRRRWYVHRHAGKLEAGDPSPSFGMLRGTIIHRGLDLGKQGMEYRLWGVVDDDHVMSGKPDLVEVEDGNVVISDIKTCRRLPAEPYESHLMQLRLYGWLLRNNGCYLPVIGRIYYLSAGDGLIAYEDPVVPCTTGEIHTLIHYSRQIHQPDANPRGIWECKDCPFSACDGRLQSRPKAQTKPAPMSEFGLDDVIDERPPVPMQKGGRLCRVCIAPLSEDRIRMGDRGDRKVVTCSRDCSQIYRKASKREREIIFPDLGGT